MNEWEKIDFSLDLVNAIQNHLKFLKEIDDYNIFYEGHFLDRALYRYEKLWLPLYSSYLDEHTNKILHPPIDVSWVWHCHMLCPTEYEKDCSSFFGKVLPSSNSNYTAEQKDIASSAQYWEEKLDEKYDYNKPLTNQSNFNGFKTKITYNIKLASSRQKNFYYQVSLPHFSSRKFLELAIKRYRKFILLKSKRPDVFVVPCFGIDLSWHAHQTHPIEYGNDTRKYIGFLFPHDDSINDRTPGSQLCNGGKITSELWKSMFNENFFFPGGMFRGDKPNPTDFSTENYDFKYFFERTGKLMLQQISLEPKVKGKSINNNYNVRILRDNKLLNEIKLTVGENVKCSKTYDYYEYQQNSLDINLEIILLEGIRSKIKNVFSSGHTHNSKMDDHFILKLQLPKRSDEIQEFKMNAKGNLLLKSDWKLSIGPLLPVISFNLINDEFQQINMKSKINEYKVFDFKNKNFEEKRNEAIRAFHKIMIGDSNRQLSQPYTVEVLHIIAHKWSSIRIMSKDKVLSTANLINQESLPIDLQGIILSNQMVLEKFEKVMLVRNIKGDYGMIKGKWTGFVPRSRKAPAGYPGYLTLKYYSFITNKTQVFQVTESMKFTFSTETIQVDVNLTTGTIKCSFQTNQINNEEIESLLSIVFSIAVLYILLTPKKKEVCPPATNRELVNSKATRPIPKKDLSGSAFILGMGYMSLINTNGFINLCHNPAYFHDNSEFVDNNDFRDGDYGNHDSGGGWFSDNGGKIFFI
jgi:hypothetical protein